MKRMLILLLAATMLCGCATASAQDGPAWKERRTWVIYDGELDCILDDGTCMRFVVEYRSPMYEENSMKCFWLAYVPEDYEEGQSIVYIALGPEDHDLVFCDDGGYLLLIREPALKECYEFWLACEIGAAEE